MFVHHGLRCGLLGRVALVAAAIGFVPVARAEESKAVVAGVCVSETGSFLRRTAEGQPWQVVKKGEKLNTGDLLIGGVGGTLESADGSARLRIAPDLAEASPFPIIETAVTLLPPSEGSSLDFRFERGRVILENTRDSGAVQIHSVVGKDHGATFTLQKPGTTAALEMYGRWPAGASFKLKPGPEDVPQFDLLFLVLKGEVTLKTQVCTVAMTAPPGPALLYANSIDGCDRVPQRLEKLPEWADPSVMETEKAKAAREVILSFRKTLVEKGPQEAISAALKSDNPHARKLAIYAMAALDDLDGLRNALMETKLPDVWENGIVALRHWIGRAPGQDLKLYERMTANGAKPAQAMTFIQLLHTPGQEMRSRPEFYETLIAMLSHPSPAIRALANWHLVRLVPQGKEIGFNPAGTEEARTEAIAKWEKLVPAGKLPPRADGK